MWHTADFVQDEKSEENKTRNKKNPFADPERQKVEDVRTLVRSEGSTNIWHLRRTSSDSSALAS